MVLFSHPDAVREVFRLDPRIAPAGQSWEFLRPFAGPHSILLLDGEEHLRERRLLQAPFHGERMRAFSPLVAELAQRELGTWSGRVVALERMRQLTLEIILRVVFGASSELEVGQLRDAIEHTLQGVRSLPRVLSMVLVRRDLGPRSPWGRFRAEVERFDRLLLDLVAQRRAHPDGESLLSALLEQRDEEGNPPTDRHIRDQLVALLVGGHDSSAASLAWAFERLAHHPAVQARLGDGELSRRVDGEAMTGQGTVGSHAMKGEARLAGDFLYTCGLTLRLPDLKPYAEVFAPEAIRAARRFAFYDVPFGYKGHIAPTPYLGGAAVTVAFVVALALGAGHPAQTVPLLAGVLVMFALGPVDDVMSEVLARNGPVTGVIDYLAKPDSRWLVVPGIRGTLLLCSCTRFDLLKQHAGIDILAMYPAGAEPTKAAEAWTWDAFLGAAEKCHKAGFSFGLPLGVTTDSVEWLGAFFRAFGAEIVDGFIWGRGAVDMLNETATMALA